MAWFLPAALLRTWTFLGCELRYWFEICFRSIRRCWVACAQCFFVVFRFDLDSCLPTLPFRQLMICSKMGVNALCLHLKRCCRDFEHQYECAPIWKSYAVCQEIAVGSSFHLENEFYSVHIAHPDCEPCLI